MDLKLLKKNNQSYLKLDGKVEKIPNTSYLRKSYIEFFDDLGAPDEHRYTDYFKRRLYKLSVNLDVRPESFIRELNGYSNRIVKDRGILRVSGKYKLEHEHIESMHRESLILNINKHIKGEIKEPGDYSKAVSNMFSSEITGHWLIYKRNDNIKYYLDVCLHGEDQYIKNTGIKIYLSECPFLFQE